MVSAPTEEGRLGELVRFLLERRRSGQPNRLARAELGQPLLDLSIVQGRLVHVADGDLELHARAEHRLGDPSHAAMAGVQRVKGPGKIRFEVRLAGSGWSP